MRTDLIHCSDGAMIEAIRPIGDGQLESIETFAIVRPGGPIQLVDMIWVCPELRRLL